MLHLRFLSMVLGLLLVMHSIRGCCSAQAHQDKETTRSGLAASDQGYIVSASEELVDDVASISIRKPWLEGRKMAARKGSWKEFRKEKEQVKDKGISEISGKSSAEASKKSLERTFQYQVDYDQKDINMQLERKTLKPDSLGIPRSEPAVPLLNSKSLLTKTSLESPSRSEINADHTAVEAQRLLMATKEIVNLMHKDYRGMDKPRRKPPINNHEPWH